MLFLYALSVQLTLRIFFAFVFIFQFTASYSQLVTIGELRSSQEKAKSDEDYTLELLDRLIDEIDEDNLKNGYYGVLEAMLAEHTINPYKKLNFFNRGKNRLEESIQEDSNSVELRYLRLGIQMNIPSFLGYNNDINSDKSFIIENLLKQKGALGDLYFEIITYLLELENCTEVERKKLKEL